MQSVRRASMLYGGRLEEDLGDGSFTSRGQGRSLWGGLYLVFETAPESCERIRIASKVRRDCQEGVGRNYGVWSPPFRAPCCWGDKAGSKCWNVGTERRGGREEQCVLEGLLRLWGGSGRLKTCISPEPHRGGVFYALNGSQSPAEVWL